MRTTTAIVNLTMAALLMSACGGSGGNSSPDVTTDSEEDATTDTLEDVAVDSEEDATTDSVEDVAVDSEEDATTDSVEDVAVDSEEDATEDSVEDVAVDSVEDVPADEAADGDADAEPEDLTPPTTTPSPVAGSYSGARTVELICEDDMSGCDQTYYTTDGTTPGTGSAVYDGTPISISSSMTLRFFSVDLAGNVEDVQDARYVIDTIDPLTLAFPEGGIFSTAQSVELICYDAGGAGCNEVHYTTDGTEPTASSPTYAGPIDVTATTELRFFGIDDAGNVETTKSETYVIDSAAPVTTASVPSGAYDAALSVTLTCDDGAGSGCAATYYTTDGTDPTTGSPVYGGPVDITDSTQLRFFSVDLAGNTESVVAVDYVLDFDAPTTTISPLPGAYTTAQSAVLTCHDGTGSGCAATYYTTDGSTPTPSSTEYSGAIAVTDDVTIRYMSVDAAGNEEVARSATYVIDADAPTVWAVPTGGLYNTPQSVALTCDDGDQPPCDIYYTTDGSTPTSGSTPYGTPIALSSDTTLRFIGIDEAGNASAVATEAYTFDFSDPTVMAAPPGGVYSAPQDVVLTCDDGGNPCTIHYTTDGSMPTTSSPVYSSPILVAFDATLRFFAQDDAGNTSSIVTESYVIDTVAPTVTASPAGGLFSSARWVSLGCDETCTIYYTTDGSTPTTSSAVYSSLIYVSTTTTLKFFAVDQALNASGVVTEVYQIDNQPPTVTATPPAGTYGGAQSVTLTCVDSGPAGCASVYYTTNGTTPTTSSPVYSSPIAVSTTTLLRYFARDNAGNSSPIQSGVYTIDTDPPDVIATYPVDGAVKVDGGVIVAASFNEDLDPASIDQTSLTLEQVGVGPVAGLVFLDAASDTVRFTPDFDLDPGAVFRATVAASIEDAVGNPHGITVIFEFTTDFEIIQVSGAGSAPVANRDIAHNLAGDGMEVWVVDSNDCTYFYNYYDSAAGTWSGAQPLYSSFFCNSTIPMVRSNGFTFMVVWVESTTLVGREFAGGTWSTKQTIRSLGSYSNGDRFSMASDGDGYAVGFITGSPDTANVSIYSAGTWGAPVAVQTTLSDASGITLGGGPAGYVAAWRANGNPYASTWTTSGGWTAEQQLSTATVGYPVAAVSNTQYMVGWTVSGAAWAAISSGAAFTSAQVGTTSTTTTAMDASSNGNGFAYVYKGYMGSPLYYELFANTYSGTWGPQTTISADSPDVVRLASTGAGYGLVMEVADDIRYIVHNGASWGAEADLETGVDAAANPRIAPLGTGYAATWDQGTAEHHEIHYRPFDGSSAGAETFLVGDPLPGHSEKLHIAVNDAGEIMAVWLQEHRGANAVFASIWDGTDWSVPDLVEVPSASPSVGTDGTDFMVAFNGKVVEYSTVGGWGTPVTVMTNAGDSQVASNGVDYAVSFGTRVSVREAGVWSASTNLSTWTGVSYDYSLVSNGTSYLLAWRQGQTYGAWSYAALASEGTYSAGTWSWSTMSQLNTSVSDVSAASNGVDYLVTYDAGNDVSGRFYDGTWSGEMVIDQSSKLCGAPHAASDGVSYAVSYGCQPSSSGTKDFGISTYGAGTWTEQIIGTTSAYIYASKLFWSGTDWGVLYRTSVGLSADQSSGATWPTTPWPTVNVAAYNELATIALGHDGAHFVGLWEQEDTAYGIFRIHAKVEP